MELRRIRMLSSVVAAGSIGGAARALGIAQPALSRQMKELDAEAEVALLARDARGVRLTPAGRAFTDAVAGIDRRLAIAVHRAQLAQEGRLGRLRIGLGRLALDDPSVGHAILALRAEHPGIDVSVVEIGGPMQTHALLRGEIDLTIGTEESPAHRQLERRTMRVELIQTAVLPASHPQARAPFVTPAELADLPLLMPGRGAGWVFPAVRKALDALGFSAPVEHESMDTVYALVAGGLGWMPSARFYEAASPAGTAAVPLRGLAIEVPLVLRWRRGKASALLARAVRLLLKEFRRQESLGARPNARQRAPRRPPTETLDEPSSLDLAFAARIEARHLRALVAIAFAGSITDAARRLGLTQSAVSRQLATFERILGTSLFERSGASLALTAAGEEMRAQAAAVLAAHASACAAARLAAQGIARRCALGFSPSPVANARVRELLRRRAQELAAVSIEVFEMSSDAAREALRTGRIDAGLMLRLADVPEGDEFESRTLAEDPLDCVLVPAAGMLATHARLRPADLEGVPFVFYPRLGDTAQQDAILAALRAARIDPVMGPSGGGPRAIWRLVADGAGWTLGPRSMRVDPPPGLVALPLEGLALPASLQLLSRRGERDPHVLAVLASL